MKNRYYLSLFIAFFITNSFLFAQIDNCGANAIAVNSSCITTNYTIPAAFTNSMASPACATSYRVVGIHLQQLLQVQLLL